MWPLAVLDYAPSVSRSGLPNNVASRTANTRQSTFGKHALRSCAIFLIVYSVEASGVDQGLAPDAVGLRRVAGFDLRSDRGDSGVGTAVVPYGSIDPSPWFGAQSTTSIAIQNATRCVRSGNTPNAQDEKPHRSADYLARGSVTSFCANTSSLKSLLRQTMWTRHCTDCR